MPKPLPAPIGEVLDFIRVLWTLDSGLQATSKAMEKELAVTAQQRFVLRLVGLFPRVTPSELADILLVHPSTVTGLINRLTTRKLIVAKGDSIDRRRHRLELTRAGQTINESPGRSVENVVRETLERVDPARLAATRQTLEQLADALQVPLELRRTGPRGPRGSRSRTARRAARASK